MISERVAHALGPPPLGGTPACLHRCCCISRADMRCASGAWLRGCASLAAKSRGRGLSPRRGQRAQQYGVKEAR